MKRYEMWYAQYAQDRYMEHLSDDELSDRFRYLMENLSTLSETGQIGIRGGEKGDSLAMMELFSHALKEKEIRGFEFESNFLKGASVPNARQDLAERLAVARDSIQTGNAHLLKFGKSKYLADAAKLGKIRISLASTYDDESLNKSQRDSELNIPLQIDPKGVRIKLPDGTETTPVSIPSFRLEAPDYYVLCCAHTFDRRLFGDFDADSCLVIDDLPRFSDELHAAVSTEVDVLDRGVGPVEYVDPVRAGHRFGGNNRPIVQMSKHIRYYYQNEYRLVWVFNPAEKDIQPHLDLVIPSLPDYTRLVLL